MADFIKASFDVTLKNPFGTAPMVQHDMSLLHRIRRATLPPKAIGVAVGVRFRDGIETEQVESLQSSIRHGGDAPSALPLLPNRLRDWSPSPIPIIRSAASRS